jgi:hypothetical protein
MFDGLVANETDAELQTQHNYPIVFIFFKEWKTKENRGTRLQKHRIKNLHKNLLLQHCGRG